MGEESEGFESYDARRLDLDDAPSGQKWRHVGFVEGWFFSHLWHRIESTYGEHLARVLLRAVSLLDQLLRGGLEAILHAEDIDAEHALKVLWRELKQRFDLGDASVCDPARS